MNTHLLRMTTLFLLLACTALYFYTGRQQSFYLENAGPTARQIISDISSWEKPLLLTHLSDEAKKTTNDQQLDRLLDHYRQFGQLQSIGELQFSRLASALSLLGTTHINFESEATFSNARTLINLTLIEQQGRYKLYNFTINNAN